MLLEAGADPSKPHEGCHPIHTALQVKSNSCAATLLEFHPEQIHVRDTKYGGTPLHWAKTKEASICSLWFAVFFLTNGSASLMTETLMY